MADGSKKAIEEVAIGESVLTMNHDTGEMTAEPVFFIHKAEMGNAFTLHFSNGTDMTVVKEHGFFEKDNNCYVTLNPQNASSYIGRRFYCAEASEWVELNAVTPVEGTVGTYALFVAHTLNHLANGMLSVILPTFPVYNAFEYGDNLTIDSEKKAADIALYGTMDYEVVKDVMSAEFFDALNGKYAPVLIGKGMATLEDCLRLAATYFPQNNAKQSARRRAGKVEKYHVTLSGKVIISGNKKLGDNSPSNLAVSEGMLSIGTLEAGSMIGIDLCISDKESEESTTQKTNRADGIAASDAEEDDLQYFTSDNSDASIIYNEGKLEIHTYEDGICKNCGSECLHTFASKTLTAESDEHGLYHFICDVCKTEGKKSVIKNGEGENITTIELTDDGAGNYSAADVTIEDGKAFASPVDFTVTNLEFKREFSTEKGMYTVMVPFGMSEEQAAGFGTFYTVSGFDTETETVTLAEVTVGTAAHTAYIFKPKSTETSHTFDQAVVKATVGASLPDFATLTSASATGLYGTYQSITAPEGSYGYSAGDGSNAETEGTINAGSFVKVGTGVTLPAYRAVLWVTGVSGASASPARLNVDLGDMENGLGHVGIDAEPLGLCFDLNGRPVSEPRRGEVFIMNGRKFVIK